MYANKKEEGITQTNARTKKITKSS